MSRPGSLKGFLLDGNAGPLKAALRGRRLLLRRLLLAELVAPPPALREPEAQTPLSPLADRRA